MVSKVFTDENQQYQIDFGRAIWASDAMHDAYKNIGIKDVDWVVVTEEGTLLVEYKNANIPNAANPSAFEEKIRTDAHYRDIAQKFYDSLVFVLLNGKSTVNIKFVYILERSIDDSVLRKKVRNKIKKKLPFNLQMGYTIKAISFFEVLSIEEWNEKHPIFPLTAIGATL